MREVFESLFSIGLPTAALVLFAVVLARREGRGLTVETESVTRNLPRIPTIAVSDPDAHLGRVGTE